MSFSDALVWVSAITAAGTVMVYFIQAMWPQPTAEAQLESRALQEVALLRDEVSKLRLDTHRDTLELREQNAKHERAFVETTHRVNDALKEVTKLSMAYGQMRK